jgi:hypothetical protein
VHLIVHLIYVLTAYQVFKFLEGDNLDNLAVVFVFSLPQFLAKYNHILNTLVKDSLKAGTL